MFANFGPTVAASQVTSLHAHAKRERIFVFRFRICLHPNTGAECDLMCGAFTPAVDLMLTLLEPF